MEKSKQISITLSPYVYEQLKLLSEKRHLKKSAIVTIALEKLIREEERLGKDI